MAIGVGGYMALSTARHGSMRHVGVSEWTLSFTLAS